MNEQHVEYVGPHVEQHVEQVPTRELILIESILCFAEAGYDGTSLNDIAASVGIRRQSLLHHFPSKEQLYREVFERMLGDWITQLAGVIDAKARGFDKVESVLQAGFDFFADNPSYVRLVRREAIDGGAHLGIDLAAALRPIWDRSVAFFQREMDAGTFRRHDPEQLLLTGYGALLSYFSDAPLLSGLLDVDPLERSALERRRQHITSFYKVALLP